MRRILLAVALGVAALVVTPLAIGQQAATPKGHNGLRVRVFATGLNNPRGLTFGPDGRLYVAEAGLGGTNATTPAQCTQVPAPIGPYTGSTNDPVKGGRISRISRRGVVTHLVTGLPSSQTAPASGGLAQGVADVAFLNGNLYALEAGAGCSHGVPTVPNAVLRVRSRGRTSIVADLSAFLKANPVKNPEPDDFEPDGTWYSMTAANGALFAVEPNHGEVDRVTPTGSIRRVVDVSATQGHVVPTAIVHRGIFYLGNLGTFGPEDKAGDEHVFTITGAGRLRIHATGVEKVLGLAFRRGKLYALEMSTTAGGPTPGTGRIVQVRSNGKIGTVIATGLTFPTGMTVGPDGRFYVSENGFGAGAGQGQILRIG